ncbi:oxidoreductase, short chain dehydrogenase/reductase superfamily protein [Acanthamoeba castellanii str. Neff]|uniref:Oxidoreductase, short chain dehydrogenase/reductase superfamily protein n=1 Tax=Acanthamoeba castellanii (strain ATCC 30010 / Neff) TaxID=1257118 RepID=L8H8Q6_ACACF|nr:oxidoreductase, short chain dehydrogenase/reductase superfamily protein [Acanthamoeba castellanii str. Neff]ELR20856.1 oxidoreductase, short chain dehydrogenase/reductase superfamily protein [Acanthamoeba castellanii str. Neff]
MAMEGKVAVITGGGSGIGKSTAVVLAKEGAVVAIFDTEEQRLREVKQEIENSMGTECFTFAGSVSSEVDTIKFYEQVREKFGQVDCVLANAGTNGTWAPIEELTSAEFMSTINVNLLGSFLTIKCVSIAQFVSFVF